MSRDYAVNRIGKTIAVCIVALCFLIVAGAILLPSHLPSGSSSSLKWLYEFAGDLVFDIAATRGNTQHPLAFSVSYFLALVAGVIAAAICAAIWWQRSPGPAKSGIPFTFLVGGLVVLAVPFLPLVPSDSYGIFSGVQEAIGTNRIALAIWSVLIFLGYFGVLLGLLTRAAGLFKGN